MNGVLFWECLYVIASKPDQLRGPSHLDFWYMKAKHNRKGCCLALSESWPTKTLGVSSGRTQKKKRKNNKSLLQILALVVPTHSLARSHPADTPVENPIGTSSSRVVSVGSWTTPGI